MSTDDLDALPTGKLPPELLFPALGRVADQRVLQGPGIGRDAAIIDWGDRALVVTSDPITFPGPVASSAGAPDPAALAVVVNANDIFAVGAEPHWLLATILASPPTSPREIAALLRGLQRACDEAGVALVGGHTEITDAAARTVVSCTLIGSAPLDRIIASDGARDGDAIIQAGAAAVEGTAILGHPALLARPGVSIAPAARALREVDGVHAMHDVTEGGIASAALELAEAAALSPSLVFEDIIWLPQTLAVCEFHGLNPLGLLGSGTLLAAVAPDAAASALAALAEARIPASVIGYVGAGIPATLKHGGRARPLPRFTRDEALRALAD